MPKVTLGPINQCTFDDPPDAAEPPSIVPDPPRGPNLHPSCDPAVPGAGGRGGNECTDALVRRFSGEGGAPAADDAASERESSSSCVDAGLRALAACSTLLLVNGETPSTYKAAQGVTCAGAVAALVECLVKPR